MHKESRKAKGAEGGAAEGGAPAEKADEEMEDAANLELMIQLQNILDEKNAAIDEKERALTDRDETIVELRDQLRLRTQQNASL